MLFILSDPSSCVISSPGQRPCELLPSLGVRLSVVRRKLSHFNLLLWNPWTELTKPGRDGPWVGPFQNCVQQPRPLFKMAAATKNRNFFNCPLLLYRVPTLPGKREKSGNSVYTFHGREKSLNFIEIAKIRGKIGNFIAGQGSFVVPNLFGY